MSCPSDDKQLTPNLFIIGAMKSGTTSLHNYLKLHSDIFMSEPKELWYFVEERNWFKGREWYLQHFSHAQGESFLGESSADYTMWPKYRGVAQKIHTFNPDAFLIYIMRDPIDRAISHYWHLVRWHKERRDIMSVLAHNQDIINVSNYNMQLEEYYQFFEKERIYTLTLESLIADPIQELNGIFDWLGVGRVGQSFLQTPKKYNEKPNFIEIEKGRGLLNDFRYSFFWNNVYRFFPQFLRDGARRVAVRNLDSNIYNKLEVTMYLREIFQPQVAKLSTLLEKEFQEWGSLHGNK